MKSLSHLAVLALAASQFTFGGEPDLYPDDLDVEVPPIASDESVRYDYDYDIVYVRSPRAGDKVNSLWPEIAHPALMDPYTGLVPESFAVTADFAIDGWAAGQNLAGKFVERSQGVWEMKLKDPIEKHERGTLTVTIKDREGNVSRIERVFSVGN